ncbi:MAG: LacI family DNA-binding transcriptional regulator [Bacteroidota bacterium]
MEKGRVTIKDLAKTLNISTSTVSRALRDHHEIKEETKNRVLALAAELDYQPNAVSLSLLNRKTFTIGVIVPKMGYHFFSAALEGIDAATINAGYTVMVCQTNESYEREVQNIRNMAAGRVDGILVSVSGATDQYDHFKQIKKKGIPLVFFDRECEALESSIVVANNYDAASKAVAHLISRGCKKIAYLGGPEHLSLSKKRLAGYRDTLLKNGLQYNPSWVMHCDVSRNDAMRITAELLELTEKPDAIFAMSDRFATSAMSVIKQKGLRIPEDIALIGFNNEPMTDIVSPSLSTIAQPEFEIGKKAAELLLQEINLKEGEPVNYETVVMETELIIRESSMRKIF